MCKQLVEMMNGQIGLENDENDENEGSTFWFYLGFCPTVEPTTCIN